MTKDEIYSVQDKKKGISRFKVPIATAAIQPSGLVANGVTQKPPCGAGTETCQRPTKAMAIDMGGPFNKAAYVFASGAFANDPKSVVAATLMAAVMVGGMTQDT